MQPAPTPPNRTPLYIGLGVLAVLAVVAAVVALSGGDDETTGATDPTESVAPDSAPPPDAPTTLPETTVVETTVVQTTVVETTVPETTPPTTLAETTVPETTLPSPQLVDVADASGAWVVQLPSTFQTNTEPVTLGGVSMRHVSGAVDIAQYLTGDFSVLGTSVLTAPIDEIGSAADMLALFDPGEACTLSNTELGLPTGKGAATMLGYDQCGGGDYAMILVAVEITEIGEVLFVGLQGTGPADGPARTLALNVLESVRLG